MMGEQAFRFGRAQHLIGIAGLPTRERADTGVIVLNAGLIHRIGPFRMNVELTRELNLAGYPTLRFDMSTLGDSGASGESQSRRQQVCADIVDAMDLLQAHGGVRRFVLVGLCAGAENAHTVACSEAERVAGAVFLDGYAYRTAGYRLRHYLPRLLDPRRWWRRLRPRRTARATPGGGQPAFTVAPKPRLEVCTDYAAMLTRGQKLCLIYSGGIGNFFNHQRQFRESFGRVVEHAGMSTRFLGETDHTYILTGDRQRLFEHIRQWLARQFPVAQAGVQP